MLKCFIFISLFVFSIGNLLSQVPTISKITTTDVVDCKLKDGTIIVSTLGSADEIEYSIDNGKKWQRAHNFIGLDSGYYVVSVRYIGKSEIAQTPKIRINRPDWPIIKETHFKDISNCDASDGVITISASGSYDTLQYSIDGGNTWYIDSVFRNLKLGDYPIAVKYASNKIIRLCQVNSDTLKLASLCLDTSQILLCTELIDYNLFNAITVSDHSGKWTDEMNTGALVDSIITIKFLTASTYRFVYVAGTSRNILNVKLVGVLAAGTAKPEAILCSDSINLYSRLNPGYNAGGNWYLNGQKYSDTNIKLPPNVYDFMYIHPAAIGCIGDSVKGRFIIDTVKPTVTCIPNHVIKIDEDQISYKFNDRYLSPYTNDNCGIASILNNYNNDSTLYGYSLATGSYTIKWIVTDGVGNVSECITQLFIKSFDVPTLFTPNGDGINDTWEFEYDAYFPFAIVEVFNRWGRNVYTSDRGYRQKWDGKSESNELPAGGYYYIITDRDGTVLQKGSVAILR